MGGLIVVLLLVGAVRTFTLVLWRPICGYGDNSDMIRVMAVFDLWPTDGGRGVVHWASPARRYAFGRFGPECSVYSSQILLMAPAVAAMRVVNHFAPATAFDVRCLGFSQALILTILACGYCLRFWRTGHRRAAWLNAVVFAVLLADPMNTLFFNGFFTETASLIFGYFAVLAGVDLCLAGPAPLPSVVFALSVFCLGTSKQQHLPTALLLGPAFAAAVWYYRGRLTRTLTVSTAAAMFLAIAFVSWNFSRHDGLAIAMVRGSTTNTILGGVLPLTRDRERAVQLLGLPHEYVAYVGKTWCDQAMSTRIAGVKIFDVPRARLLWLFWDDPSLLWRLVQRGMHELEGGRQGTFAKEGMVLTYLGYSEGHAYDRIPFPSLCQWFCRLGYPAYRLLFLLPLALLPLCAGRAIWLRGSQTPGIELPVLVLGPIAYACFMVTILGDGYWEFAKHNHLTFNLLLALLLLFLIDLGAGLARLAFRRWGQRSLSPSQDAAVVADRAPGAKKRISGGLVAGLTFALFVVLSSGLVVGLAEPPALPSWNPAQVAHQSRPCGAVEEGSWLPGGNLRLAGWACNPRTGKSIRAIILVRQGRV